MTTTQSTRSTRRPWRFRTRLALALLAIVVPISILLVITHIQDLNERRDSRVETFETVSETVAASIDGFATDLESFTLSTSITLSAASGSTPYQQASVGPYFKRLVDSHGTLRALFLTDTSGKVIASSDLNPTSIGVDLSSRDYIKALQSGRESVWSGAFAGQQTGQTTMAQGRIIKGADGTPLYFLVAAFYTDRLAERLPKALPADAQVSLIDADGSVMYSSQEVDETRLNVAESPIFLQAKEGRPVRLRGDEGLLARGGRYGAYVPVNRNGWVVGFTRPASVVDGPLQSRFQRDIAIMAALLLGGYAVILFLSSRLSRPLGQLASAANAISRGQTPSVPIRAADADVRTLQEAMASMSLAIADRESRLQAQARVLETLERVGETLATELNLERAVEAVARAALELTDADASTFFYYPPSSNNEPTLSDVHIARGGAIGLEPPPVGDGDPLLSGALRGETILVEDASTDRQFTRERLLRGAGSMSARNLLALPVISRDGRVLGGLMVLHASPKRFNEDQIHLATGLARRGAVIIENARLYGEAEAIQDELRRSNVAKDEFIGVMSHELRTPITTIYGGARLLHARRRHLDESDVEEMVASIEEEAERLYRLVENLLALARIDLGEVVAGEPISLGPTVEQAVKQFVSRHPSRPVTLHVEDQIPPVRGETTYVHQVVHNLITNADKYSEVGLPIEVTIGVEGDDLAVRVSDNGKGVAPEEMGQIFESFFRSARTARDARGKGLGLTVCKRLVETMNGRIWARNRDQGGLEVGFTLPIAVEEADALEAAEAGTSP